jgi:hypothetical protein
MISAADYVKHDAVGLADLVRKKEVSPRSWPRRRWR